MLAAGPVGAIRAAATAGYDLVGIRLAPAHAADPSPSLLADPALMREVRQALAGTGIAVLDVEVVRLRPDTDVRQFEPMLEAGAELGAQMILAVSHVPDEARTAAALNALAESAAVRGLSVALEFMGFSEVRTAAAAARVVALAGHPALGILADSLHLARTGGSAADLAGLPLLAAQLCDGPAAGPGTAEAMAAEARTARLMPGAGELPLGDFVAALPPGVAVSLEVPSAAAEDPVRRATRGRAALRAFGI